MPDAKPETEPPRPTRRPRPLPGKPGRIPRVRDLDAATFRRDFLAPSRPVIIEGGAARWPALSRWAPSLFREVAGDLGVPVRQTDLDQPEIASTRLGQLDADQAELRLSTVLSRCERPYDVDEELYVPGIALWQVPALAGDWSRPAFTEGLPLTGATIWLGRNTRSVAHYHPAQQALLAQVAGEKRVSLYAPEDLRHTYLFPPWSGSFYRSRVNFHGDHFERYPALAEATVYEDTLQPGDLIFIPVHWLHVPVGIGWSVSLTMWWKAKLSEWSFPTPGAQSLVWNGVQRAAEAAVGARALATKLAGRAEAAGLPANAIAHRFWNRLRWLEAMRRREV